jgi:SMEK domain-containing protein
MMLHDRKRIFDNISRIIAITRYDIEQHQSINDQSMNIHGENWIRDILNFIYDEKFENANFESTNTPAIDLVSFKSKIAYQITTTKSKGKVEKSLKGIKKTRYKAYDLYFYFLLDKSKFSSSSIQYFKINYNIDINDKLLDYTDLLKTIENLEIKKLNSLYEKYFKQNMDKYTDEIVLDLIIKHLIKNKKRVILDYDDDFGTEDVRIKLIINKINDRLSSEIKKGMDYQGVIDNFIVDGNLIPDLRHLIIDNFYHTILLNELKKNTSIMQLRTKKTSELQDIASSENIDFNRLINKLHQAIINEIEINDFNSMDISWIIISYFFELCDVGVDKKC